MRGNIKDVLPLSYARIVSILFLVVMLVASFAGCSDDSDKDELPSVYTSPSGIEMVSIPGGSFEMGDLTEGEGRSVALPVHTVTLSPFSMAQYEVTYEKWMEVKNWAESYGYTFVINLPGAMGSEDDSNSEVLEDETHPVTYIAWHDMVLWCNALSEKEGLTPCYYTSSAKTTVYRSGLIDIENDWVDWDADGYRLPTEAEWEYACRAGTTTKYSFGDAITEIDANYDENENGTVTVGSYSPNDWGLHDMHGNVVERCWDWYDKDYYNNSPSSDPRGPSNDYSLWTRVAWSGDWKGRAVTQTSAYRLFLPPNVGFGAVGFRPVHSN